MEANGFVFLMSELSGMFLGCEPSSRLTDPERFLIALHKHPPELIPYAGRKSPRAVAATQLQQQDTVLVYVNSRNR